ncbi:MAG: hypothetical protein ABJ057_12820 [Erythrobacter sp.]
MFTWKNFAGCLGVIIILFGVASIWMAFQFGYLPRNSFDAGQWKQAEADNDNPRVAMVDSLIASGVLDRKTRSEVLDLLGPATDTNYFSDWDTVYWLGRERGFIRIDSEWLVLRFDEEGKISEYKLVRD